MAFDFIVKALLVAGRTLSLADPRLGDAPAVLGTWCQLCLAFLSSGVWKDQEALPRAWGTSSFRQGASVDLWFNFQEP